MSVYNILSLCDGMGTGLLAFLESLKRKKIESATINYYAVEFDKWPRMLLDDNMENIRKRYLSYELNLIRPCNDVNEIGAMQVLYLLPKFDVVMFGSPCQSVSVAGKGEGLDGKSGLLLKCMEVLALAKYKNQGLFYLIENVKMKKEFKAQFDKIIGGESILINSALVSAQNRQRWYWTNFGVEQLSDKGIVIADILEENGEGHIKYHGEWKIKNEKSQCIDANYQRTLIKYSESNRYKRPDGTVSSYKKDGERFIEKRAIPSYKSLTLTTGDGCGSGMKSINLVKYEESDFASYKQDAPTHVSKKHPCLRANAGGKTRGIAITENNTQYRKLTVRECARLQTIPEWFDFSMVSKTQAYKAIGNGWTLEVIAHILSCLKWQN